MVTISCHDQGKQTIPKPNECHQSHQPAGRRRRRRRQGGPLPGPGSRDGGGCTSWCQPSSRELGMTRTGDAGRWALSLCGMTQFDSCMIADTVLCTLLALTRLPVCRSQPAGRDGDDVSFKFPDFETSSLQLSLAHMRSERTKHPPSSDTC